MNVKKLKIHDGDLGSLIPIELIDIDMEVKRIFFVKDVPVNTIRGNHAHYKTKQILCCINGQIEIILFDGVKKESQIINKYEYVYVDNLIWDSQRFITEDTVLFVMASTNFDLKDYIFDKDEFIKIKNRTVTGVYMCNEEIDLIKKYLDKDSIVLEYGSGGSTLHFSKYVKEYHSIEHDFSWFSKIKSEIINLNTTIYYQGTEKGYNIHNENIIGNLNCPSDRDEYNKYCLDNSRKNIKGLLNFIDNKWKSNHKHKAKEWGELKSSENYKIYKSYIEYPKLIGKKFDIVIVDGRSRPECVRFIYDNDLLSKNGYIIIHDFWVRAYYYVVFEKFKEVDGLSENASLVVLQKKDYN